MGKGSGPKGSQTLGMVQESVADPGRVHSQVGEEGNLEQLRAQVTSASGRAVQQVASKKVPLTKATTYKTAKEKAKKEQFQEVDQLKLENLQQEDFEMGMSEDEDSDSGGLPADLQKTLRIKNEKPNKDGSKANQWEAESKVDADTTTAAIQEKLLKFKAELTKDIGQLEVKQMEVKKTCPDPALQKKMKKAAEEGQAL
eukprot:symbB.v1.2.033880.t1/scaffold4274.1/size42556/2